MRYFWIVLAIGLVIIFIVYFYRKGIKVGGLTIGGARRGILTNSTNMNGQYFESMPLISENIKNRIMNLHDVTGIGTGIIDTKDPNSYGVLIGMSKQNTDTEVRIKSLLDNVPYKITIVGVPRPLVV